MSMEWLRQLLDALWDKLKIIFERALNAPEIIRAWSEGRASLGDRASLIVALVLVVAVLAWIVNFFKAGFWKKLGMLFSAALIVFAAAVVLSFFSTTGESPALESPDASATPAPPQVSGAAENPADAPAPSASPEQPSYRRSDGQYSLARGEIDPLSMRASGMWRLCDDTISWQLGDGLVLQMSRLNSLPGVGRFGKATTRTNDENNKKTFADVAGADEEKEELRVLIGRLTGREEVLPIVRGNGPVVVLSRSVHACERLLMEQAYKAMSCRDLLHHLHCELVVVCGHIGGRVDRCQLMLCGGNLVVLRLGKDPELPELLVQILHE